MKNGKGIGSGKRTVLFRITMCVGIIVSGIVSMKVLESMSTPPAEKIVTEEALQVKTIPARFENIQTWLLGFGEARSLNVVTLSPETSGRVTMIHSRLEQGEIIRKGEALFMVDTADDMLSYDNGRKRLKVLQRSLALAQNDYMRIRRLYHKNQIGTLSGVEKAEKETNSLLDQISQLELSVKTAELNLKRATVTAPFDARITNVNLEKGQFVSPGSASVTLADDSVLEVHVSIDADKAMRLLQFESDGQPDKTTRFGDLKQVPSRVTWSQGGNSVQMTGMLHRIVEFAANTRTLKVAVRLKATTPASGKNRYFPIVEGMFCKVEIPGKTLSNVVRLPQQAVNPNNSVYVMLQNRLKTVPVTIGYRNEKEALISDGLNPNDRIIVSRLADPLENTLVQSSTYDQLAQSIGRQP